MLTGYNTFKSPHYNDSHRAFRAKVRAFMDKEVTPFCNEVRHKHNKKTELRATLLQRELGGLGGARALAGGCC